jgi:hypothetical protein
MNKVFVWPGGLVNTMPLSCQSDDYFVVTPETTAAELLAMSDGNLDLVIEILTELEMMG